jgi:cytochrome b subunit of formate dehydrogenase
MSLAMKRMVRTGNDPSRWIYEHHIDWDERIRSSSLS